MAYTGKCKSEAQKKAIRTAYAKKVTLSKGKVQYPHFRYHKPSGHPALVVERFTNTNNKDEFYYHKTGHDDNKGNAGRDCYYPNPNPHDDKPMYIERRKRHDLVNRFESVPLSWKYNKNNKKQ